MTEMEINATIQNSKKTDPNFQAGKVSDGYHTFNELYDHRIMLYIGLAKMCATKTDIPVWKSKAHSNGEVWDGWFLLGIEDAPGKQITYHLPTRYWHHCDFAELKDKAAEFDGHTSADVIARLEDLIILGV